MNLQKGWLICLKTPRKSARWSNRVGLAAAISALSVTSAFAQTSRTTSSTESVAPDGLQEIVVTAQRREENLEKTPVSVAVLTATELAKRSIVSEADLQSAVPGLTVRETQNSNQLNYAIRGQSVDAFSSSRPAVLPYFDEFQSSPSGSSAFFDLQSVQVLKGPQGTLFGRNATGGAVLFTTTKPADNYDGYVDLQGGNYNYEQAEAAINLPIIDHVLLSRIAVFYEHRDGFQTDVFSGADIGKVERKDVRLSLTFRPSDVFSNDLVLDYAYSGGSSTAAVTYSVYPLGFNKAPIPANFFYNPAVDSVFGPGAWNAHLAATPRANATGLIGYAALQNSRGPYEVNLGLYPAHKAENSTFVDTAAWDVSSDVKIKNILGYARSTSSDLANYSGSPFVIENEVNKGNQINNWLVSDEVQVLGNALAQHLSYVGGVYVSDEKDEYFLDVDFFGFPPFLTPAEQVNAAATRTKSYAGYAQGTYDLSDATGLAGLSFTGGARYTSEKDDLTQLPTSVYYNFAAAHPGLGAESTLSQTTNKASWKVGLQEQLNSNVLFYVTGSSSFRSGGFNSTAPPLPGSAAVGGAGFKPEVATDVEIGTKFQGTLGVMPVRLNIALYDQWVKDIQRTIYAGIPSLNGSLAGLTVNVPKAQIRGIELDGQINVAAWLNIGANFAFTDAKFTQNSVDVFGTTSFFGPFADTPRNSGSVFAELLAPLPNDIGTLSLRSSVYAQSQFFFGSLNDTIVPQTGIPGYALVNFRLGIDNINQSGWSAAAYVKNAFNRVYFAGGVPTGSVLTVNSAVPGDPRTFFGEVRYKF